MAIARSSLLFTLALIPGPAWAGPPYVSDDPEPTEYKHFEIYLFNGMAKSHDGVSGAGGLDFNYGATPDLQLTGVFPIAYDDPKGEKTEAALGNIELAAKYRFLHQSDIGWDVAVFPRLFLPSTSSRVGEPHASFLLPLWVQKDWDKWSTFGGGGCVLHRGGDAKNFCLAGWALTRQILPDLRLGLELVHQTADTKDGHGTTAIGAGLQYDFNAHYHFLTSIGPSLQNAAGTEQLSWYTSFLFTF